MKTLLPSEKYLVTKRVIENKTVSPGGIALPESSASTNNEKHFVGEIVSTPEKSAYGIGSHVVFNKHSGIAVSLEGVDYLIIHQDDVYATIVDVKEKKKK